MFYIYFDEDTNIEAKNNDGSCELNKATYSSELCEKLLKIYAPKNAVIYDPFMGSGTLPVACERLNLEGNHVTYTGIELETKWYDTAKHRISLLKGLDF